MKCVLRFAISLLLVLVSIACFAQQDSPQTQAMPDAPSSSQGWHIELTPYLWFAGVRGAAGVRGHFAGIDASASDVLSNFNLGFMASSLVRYNRVILPLDFMWIDLTDKKAIASGQGSAEAEFKETIVTPGIGYRLIDSKLVKVDALAKVRY